MAIIKINELPYGSGNLTPDDLIVFMDDPSGVASTKQASVSNIKKIIIEKSVFDIGIFSNETDDIIINYDQEKTIQTVLLIDGSYTFILGSGWPIDNSVEILLQITIAGSVNITWDIVTDWYSDYNDLNNLSEGKHTFLLRKIGTDISAYYLGNKKNNPAPYSTIVNNSVHADESATWGSSIKNVTTVGTNGDSSYYGTYDQSGNVWEWTDEQGNVEQTRILRGGSSTASWKVDSAERSPVGARSWVYIGRLDTGSAAAAFQRGFRIAASNNFLYYVAPDSYLATIRDINNSPDSRNGYGDVGYSYKIGKYPITNCEYVEFLNSVAKGGENPDSPGSSNPIPPNVYLDIMSDDNEIYGGGINRETIFENGSVIGSNVFTVKENYGNKPIINISWFSAARYCNWLHNGKLSGVAAVGTTENGSYILNNSGNPGDTPPQKEETAKYWIPTANEWYKAAYYKGGSTNSGYWNYATQSNALPQTVNTTANGNGTLTGVQPVNFTNFQCGLPENLLFDTFRLLNNVDSNVPEPWKSRIIQAANRWNRFIKFSNTNRETFIRLESGWNGIAITNVTFLSLPTSNLIASAIPIKNYRWRNRPHTYQSIRGRLEINTSKDYTESEWVAILTHELGHILGIGPSWINLVVNNFLNGLVYTQARNAYRVILSNNLLNQIAIEATGDQGTAGVHWEDSFRHPNFPGFVNELMIGSFSKTIHNSTGYVISPLTIKALVDMGYEEQTPDTSEGLPILVTDALIQSLNIQDAVKLSCGCNNSRFV